jgi:hypothetical protein
MPTYALEPRPQPAAARGRRVAPRLCALVSCSVRQLPYLSTWPENIAGPLWDDPEDFFVNGFPGPGDSFDDCCNDGLYAMPLRVFGTSRIAEPVAPANEDWYIAGPYMAGHTDNYAIGSGPDRGGQPSYVEVLSASELVTRRRAEGGSVAAARAGEYLDALGTALRARRQRLIGVYGGPPRAADPMAAAELELETRVARRIAESGPDGPGAKVPMVYDVGGVLGRLQVDGAGAGTPIALVRIANELAALGLPLGIEAGFWKLPDGAAWLNAVAAVPGSRPGGMTISDTFLSGRQRQEPASWSSVDDMIARGVIASTFIQLNDTWPQRQILARTAAENGYWPVVDVSDRSSAERIALAAEVADLGDAFAAAWAERNPDNLGLEATGLARRGRTYGRAYPERLIRDRRGL